MIDACEEEITNDATFMSVDPMQAIRKLKFKETKKLNSLVLIEPQKDEIKGEIETLLQQIHQYGVRNSFNYPNYLFMVYLSHPL